MASKINADEFVDREGEGKPTLPKGVVLSGVTTITTATVADNEIANSTGINAGIITSTHFAGNLTGDVNAGIVTVTSQTVVGSAVTISASGIDIGAGVITATSYAGSGANLTGIGATIMVWEYNPDVDSTTTNSTGIGITFNQKIKAGSGNITIRTGGYDGTVVENFGIGSSVTISGNSLSFTPTSSLPSNAYAYVTLPSGVITNMAGESYVGTAFSFNVPYAGHELWMWGYNAEGELGQNHVAARSSPVQVPGTTWTKNVSFNAGGTIMITKNDGTLWGWGEQSYGSLGVNNTTKYSSPVQVPGTTWDKIMIGKDGGYSIKTDGTLWSWGSNEYGELGLNDKTQYSSPVQIGSDSTWEGVFALRYTPFLIKNDNTLWSMGYNNYGALAQNSGPATFGSRSSPIQIPGTTWSTDIKKWGGGQYHVATVKTDGTLWSWGYNNKGQLGQNNGTHYSSPVQIPGTNWKYVEGNAVDMGMTATKTDGTLWSWGGNEFGTLGHNNKTRYSSPVQVPGTTWDELSGGASVFVATKTDNTLWSWGYNNQGNLGQNEQGANASRSSPVQIPGTTWGYPLAARFGYAAGGLKQT